MPSLVLATRNHHKLREFGRLMKPAGITVEPLPDDVVLPPEDGETFQDNALGKARAAAAATGRAVIADDSGIEAAGVGGCPRGPLSALRRRARHRRGESGKLLGEAPAGSGLRYVCALVYVDPATGVTRMFEGECRGVLTDRPAGSGGFGYDPAFVADAARDRTMAQLSDPEKDAISHRGNAVRALLEWLTG